ncbi:MAG: decaprenylphospho-beta-D-erythro-pentofuranosid-2-ulose 2-reductase [Phenylobacterium sp.]|jgi:decaprenylphospho-beta-D-erythro-pentofuranosid-2-ulose 2-reductase
MSTVLVIGAKSDIAKATARVYAKQGYDLILAARDCQQLRSFATDITLRTGKKITLVELDVVDFASHEDFYHQLESKPDGVICAAGFLGEQSAAQTDFAHTQQIIQTNYTGVVSLFNLIANDFEQRRHGFIIGISSVAGERGRKSNFVYGSAKAALTAYLSGLRNRLYESKVHVMTVNPGFVATKMTQDMDLPEKLTAKPSEVAKTIYRAQQKNRNVVYCKPIWRWIMLVIKLIPERLFKTLSI